MTAKTKFYFCGVCGFKNRPRHPQAGKPDIPTDDSKCEQCGAKRDDVNAVDYVP